MVFSPAALAPRTTPDCPRAALVAQQDLLAERDAPHANPVGGLAAAGFSAAAAAVAAEVAAVASMAAAAAAAAAAVAVAAAAVAAAAAAVVAGDVAAAEAAAPAVGAGAPVGAAQANDPPGECLEELRLVIIRRFARQRDAKVAGVYAKRLCTTWERGAESMCRRDGRQVGTPREGGDFARALHPARPSPQITCPQRCHGLLYNLRDEILHRYGDRLHWNEWLRGLRRLSHLRLWLR